MIEKAVRVFVVVYAGALLFWASYALLARFVLHGPVTAPALLVSVERETGSAGQLLHADGGCRRAEAERTWQCSVSDREGSGGAVYRVRTRPGSSCWSAALRQDASEGGMPDTVGGCVYRWQWTILTL